MNRKVGITFLALFFSFLAGCSPLYIVRMAYEEGKILWRRKPIEHFLENSDLDSGSQEKLRLVLEVRNFAREKLHMKVGGSYASVSSVDRPVLSYVLIAVPQTDLAPYTWWFLIVGRVPYKGFFHERDARAEAESLEAQGYDTYIRAAPAFSTLGWFDDPLLAHLLRYDRVTLAEIVFHELFHNTLFVKGAVDFNESLANFVGNRAAIVFFEERFGVNSKEYQSALRAWREELEFSAWVTRLADFLRLLYARQDLSIEEKLTFREELFKQSQEGWASRISAGSNHRHQGFSSQRLNNAVLANYLLYLTDLAIFESLYESLGGNLPKFIAFVQEAIEGSEDPFTAVRERLAGKPR